MKWILQIAISTNLATAIAGLMSGNKWDVVIATVFTSWCSLQLLDYYMNQKPRNEPHG